MTRAMLASESRSEAPRPLTVTELTFLVRDTLRSNPLLARILVRGEVGSVQAAAAGHVFFVLKDANAQISCVVFRDDAEGLGVELGDGMEVVASGSLDFYGRRGEVQFAVCALMPAGVGAFWATFQRTRKRLAAEGLFDAARKRAAPRFPARIGIVSSEAGAALHDVVAVLRRRWPLAEVVVAPALVQGPEAPASLRAALAVIGGRVDIVILARGGGSLEDLWCFNDEGLARAIAACPVPVVSAVGHETDVTIADFVADIRAPTPSAAGELVSPDLPEVRGEARALAEDLVRGIRDALRAHSARLAAAQERLSPKGLSRDIASNRAHLRSLAALLVSAAARAVEQSRQLAEFAARRLQALSPQATLERGYAIVRDADGRLVTSVDDARPRDSLSVRLRDGRLHVLVRGKEVS